MEVIPYHGFEDRTVEHPNRVKLRPVEGLDGVFDVERLEGDITREGTPLTAYILGKACVAYGSRIIIRCKPSDYSSEYSYQYEDFALIWALKQDAAHVRIAVAGVQNQEFGFHTHFLNESAPNFPWNITVEATRGGTTLAKSIIGVAVIILIAVCGRWHNVKFPA